MTSLLKQRLIGAIVLISLGVIFIPMLLTGKGNILNGELESNVPAKPMYEIQAPDVLPLEKREISEPVLEPIKDQGELKDQQKTEQQVAATDSEASQPKLAAPVAEQRKPDTVSVISSVISSVTSKTDATKTAEVTSSAPDLSKSEAGQAETIVPPKTTTKPAVAPAAPDTQVAKIESKKPIVSGWVVQLGSFSVEKNAVKLRDQLRKKGHASFVEKYSRNGKTSYRVRVGPELTRESADKLKEKLKKETKLDGLVLAFPAK